MWSGNLAFTWHNGKSNINMKMKCDSKVCQQQRKEECNSSVNRNPKKCYEECTPTKRTKSLFNEIFPSRQCMNNKRYNRMKTRNDMECKRVCVCVCVVVQWKRMNTSHNFKQNVQENGKWKSGSRVKGMAFVPFLCAWESAFTPRLSGTIIFIGWLLNDVQYHMDACAAYIFLIALESCVRVCVCVCVLYLAFWLVFIFVCAHCRFVSTKCSVYSVYRSMHACTMRIIANRFIHRV